METSLIGMVLGDHQGMSKAQHAPAYRVLPLFLRDLRESANLTQRDLGKRLSKPQSWVFNCETANRRVDVTEFIAWCLACEVEPEHALRQLRRQSGR